MCTTQYQHERGCLLRLKGAGTTSYPSSAGYIMSLFPSSPLWGAQRISHRHRGVFPCSSALSETSVMVIFLPHVDDQVGPPGGEGLGGKNKEASLPPSPRTTPVYPRALHLHLHPPRRPGSLQVRAKDDWRVGVAILPARSARGALRVGGASGCELGLGGGVVRVAPRHTMQQQ